MAAYLINIQRVNSGMLVSVGCVNSTSTTKAQVDQELAAKPDNISVLMGVATEAQVQGLLRYAKAIDNGANTSSVETAIAAII